MASKSGWVVELTDQAEKEMRKQPESIQADFEFIRDVIQDIGLYEVPQHYIKRLRGTEDLWEFRLTGRDTIGRALYFQWVRKRIIIVHVLEKKSQKLPRRDIALAEKRAKAFKDSERRGRGG